MVALIFMSLGARAIYASGLGGYISETLIERSGISGSSLLIGRSGVATSEIDVAMGAIVSTGAATNVYMDGTGTHATLSGILSDLKGFPRAMVYFQWGYDGAYTNETTGQTVTSTGGFSEEITGFDPSRQVYYRGAVDTDGTRFSSGSSFIASGAVVGGFNLINATVVIAYTALVLLVILAIGSHSTFVAIVFMVLAVALGVVGIGAIQDLIRSLLG